MEDHERLVKAGMAIAGGLVGWLLANTPWTVMALIGLMASDFVLGVMAAWINKDLDSDVGRRGLAKKVMVLVFIGSLALVQWAFQHTWPNFDIPAVTVVAGMYCGVEILSILEIMTRAGIPVPPVLRNALNKVRPLMGQEPAEPGDGTDTRSER